MSTVYAMEYTDFNISYIFGYNYRIYNFNTQMLKSECKKKVTEQIKIY